MKRDEKPKLEQLLLNLRSDINVASDIVEHLEDDSFDPQEYDNEFCQKYIIELIQNYCKSTTKSEADSGNGIAGSAEDKAEFMLAAYGLLKEFEYNKAGLGEREQSYYKYAHGYNKLIEGIWNGPSINKKFRDIANDIVRELAITLRDLKSKNGGKLDFLPQVAKDLSLPSLRPVNGQQPDRNKRKKMIPEHKNGTRESPLIILLFFLIAISIIKIAFFSDHKETGYQNDVRRTDSYALQDNLPTVTELKCSVLKVTIRPGVYTPLPIEINPPEARGNYLFCNSSDNSILYGMGGNEVRVYAFDDIDADASPVTVIVTVTAQNRASSDIAIEIPVEIDYNATMPESVMPEGVIS